MRALMLKERPARHGFDLKLVDGGLVDLEFIAQSAQLVAGSRIGDPERSAQVDKPVDPASAYIAELKSRCPQKAPPPDFLAELHGPGGVEFPPVDTHRTFVEIRNL